MYSVSLLATGDWVDSDIWFRHLIPVDALWQLTYRILQLLPVFEWVALLRRAAALCQTIQTVQSGHRQHTCENIMPVLNFEFLADLAEKYEVSRFWSTKLNSTSQQYWQTVCPKYICCMLSLESVSAVHACGHCHVATHSNLTTSRNIKYHKGANPGQDCLSCLWQSLVYAYE